MNSLYTQSKTHITKAGIVLCSMLVFNYADAQKCNTYYNADAINPVRLPGIYQNGWQPAFIDIDGDGDLDYYEREANNENETPALPTLYRNIGTASTPVYALDSASGFAPKDYFISVGYSQFVDIDGDGDLDYFVAEDDNYYTSSPYDLKIRFFENVGNNKVPVFVENAAKNPLAFIGAYFNAYYTLADIDGDGDYDLYIWDYLGTSIYRNTGTATMPAYVKQSYVRNQHGPDHLYYDWNKDGLLDYFVIYEGEGLLTQYYRNIGPRQNPKYVLDVTTGPVFTAGPPHQFFDINNDGVPDMIDELGGFASLVPVQPTIMATQLNVRSKTIAKLTGSPLQPEQTYQWRRNGVNIPGATTPVYIAIRNGYYTFTVTDSCGTALSNPYQMGISPIASASRQATGLAVGNGLADVSSTAMAYPNPFTSELILDLSNLNHSLTTSHITITDLQGRIVERTETNQATVHLGRTLRTGVYIISVVQNNKVVFTKKIIKE